LIILFTEVVVNPEKAPASTTTKVVVPVPMFDGGSIVTAPPEIVTLDEETPIVENAVPPALPDLNVILPVPLYTCWSKVMIILDARATPVAPIAGLNVIGTGGTFILVKVAIPALILPVVLMLPVLPIPTPVSPLPLPTNEVAVMIPVVLIFPVLPIPTPVSPLPLPTKEVAVMIPTLKFDGGEILVENPARLDALDILLLLFSYL
jgi:hypothetical protein